MRVGLLSTANINQAVLGGAAETDAAEVVAVASRDEARARAYADEHGLARAHGSYEALLADPEVDTVYVSLPNALHVEWSIKALQAGKHVLCEKPLSRHPEDAERAFDAAAEAGCVLQEAFMWRYMPQTQQLLDLVPRVGELRMVRATFSFPQREPGDVRLDAGLEGGALMDVGCYCVSAARLLCGEPEEARGVGLGKGVDARFAGVLRFAGGAMATFDCGFDMPPRSALEVVGTQGTLVLDDPWHGYKPRIKVRLEGGRKRKVRCDKVDAYRLQLEDLAAAVRGEGPPLLGREDAVGQARVLEALHP